MTPKVLKLVAAALINVGQMESSLFLDQTFYGAVTATTNSVIMGLRSTQLLTPIHAESNGSMLATVTAGKYLSYAKCWML
jgi:hypothetical protein